jgi:hypothetical protein
MPVGKLLDALADGRHMLAQGSKHQRQRDMLTRQPP